MILRVHRPSVERGLIPSLKEKNKRICYIFLKVGGASNLIHAPRWTFPWASSAYARGLDVLWNMYQWIDRAPHGRNDSSLWLRRHDEYGK
jgi:predicted dithiol-disulfide oxidoreductase (DUF899 family)